ncbi:hypothetical protein Cni_G03594 [Canna indica]|uniref:Reverse transcriptase zinc-binding domain-containing protein n=1 Tax=Canna indica TaxID=4628 RepID=A0AAQ3JTT7_9LILI|nr:hypothetical protein Cni_G03594 [Canna indica]
MEVENQLEMTIRNLESEDNSIDVSSSRVNDLKKHLDSCYNAENTYWRQRAKMRRKNISVVDAWNEDEGCWTLNCDSQIDESRVADLFSLIGHPSLSQDADSIKWRWHRLGIFSTASYYFFAMERGVKCRVAQKLRKVKDPLKIKVHMWLVLKQRLPTKEHLIMHGVSIDDDTCVFCKLGPENSAHLLQACQVSRTLCISLSRDIDRSVFFLPQSNSDEFCALKRDQQVTAMFWS